jgi:hypothetical protein
MLFNSLSFLGFFAVVAFLYYTVPHRFRWGLLLLASLFNYAVVRPVYVPLLLAVTLITYLAGLAVSVSEGRRRRLVCIGSVVLVLSALAFNKYYDFVATAVNAAAGWAGPGEGLPRADWAAAAGLSFYTLSCVSYLVDVYARRLSPERHVGRLALYVSFSWRIGLDYLTGFSKINNPDRFAPDTSADEASRFARVYRPVRQIDDLRLGYLYPAAVDAAALASYLRQFEALVAAARAREVAVVAVKMPLSERILGALPDEERFDAALRELLARHGGVLHDFSRVGNDDRFFYDTDHLNRDGVLHFFEGSLRHVLTADR